MSTTSDTPRMGDTTIRVSEELADELYQRKGRSTSYEEFLWELLEEVDQDEDRLEQDDIAESGLSEGTGVETVEPTEEFEAPPAEDNVKDAEEIVRSLDLSGRGEKYESRVNAVLEIYNYLREHPGERISRGDIESLVEEQDIDIAYSSFTSFWGNWVKQNESQGRDFNTLTQLPGVEMDGDDYIYTD